MEMANPHGDTGCGGEAQAFVQSQCNVLSMTQDWDTEVLNHVLVHILDKGEMNADSTNDFTQFTMHQGVDDAQLIVVVSEDNFKSMGCNIDFKTFQSLQALHMMCNEQVVDSASEDDENVWFLELIKCMLMCHMLHECKVTTLLTTTGDATSSVPLTSSDSNKAKLEAAWQLSLAMFNLGKPPLAPVLMAESA